MESVLFSAFSAVHSFFFGCGLAAQCFNGNKLDDLSEHSHPFLLRDHFLRRLQNSQSATIDDGQRFTVFDRRKYPCLYGVAESKTIGKLDSHARNSHPDRVNHTASDAITP